MKIKNRHPVKALAVAVALSLGSLGVMANDKAAKPGPVVSGKEAVEIRRATFNLIGKNFKHIGGILKGEVDYNSVDVEKIVNRIVFLNDFLHGTFPEDSNLGEPQSKARPEIWTKKDDFKKSLKQFRENAQNLAAVVAKEKSNSPAFKEAAQKVAQDCKSCHDNFKLK